MLVVGGRDVDGTAHVKVWHYPSAQRKWEVLAELDPHDHAVNVGFRNFTSQIEISATLFKLFDQ